MSTQGRVRNGSGHVLAQRPNNRGYWIVDLRANGERKTCTVHTLILLAHVGPRPSPKHEACHGDDNPDNNTLGNLRWALDNALDKARQAAYHTPEAQRRRSEHSAKSRATQLADSPAVARAYLSEVLAGGARPVKAVEEGARERGIGMETLKFARRDLGCYWLISLPVTGHGAERGDGESPTRGVTAGQSGVPSAVTGAKPAMGFARLRRALSPRAAVTQRNGRRNQRS